MININSVNRVLVATYKVDFRRSFDGLLAEAYKMGLDPLDGDLVLFIGRCRTKIKVLFCDKTGMTVLNKRFYNRLSNRRFKFSLGPDHQVIDRDMLIALLDGHKWNRELDF